MPETIPIEISCAAVHERRLRGVSPVLLDCREAAEHAICTIEGAVLLPMSEIVGRVEELSPHAGSDLVVYCHHGGRSLRVARWLREHGFPQAQSMAGGIDQWAAENEPGMARY